jgi:hypothetical protein
LRYEKNFEQTCDFEIPNLKKKTTTTMSTDNSVTGISNDKTARGAAVKSKGAPKKAATAVVEKKATAKSRAAPKGNVKAVAPTTTASASVEAETQLPIEMVEGEDGVAVPVVAAGGVGAGGDKKKKKKKKQEATHDFRLAVRKHVVRELKSLQESDSKTYGELGQISLATETARVLQGCTNGLIETLNARIHDFFRANPNRQTVQQLEMWFAVREIMRPPVSQLLATAFGEDNVPEDETNLHDTVREAGERAIALYNASLERDAGAKSAAPVGTKKPKVRMTDRIQTIVAFGKVQKRIRAEHSGTRLQPVAGVYATAFIDECLRFLVRCTLVRTIAAIRKKNVGSYILPKHVAQAIRKNRYLQVVFGEYQIQHGGVDHAPTRRRGANKEASKKKGGGGGGARRRPEGANGAAPTAKRQKSTGALTSRPKAKGKGKAQPKTAATAKKKGSRKNTKKESASEPTEDNEDVVAEAQDGQDDEVVAEQEAEHKGEAKRGGDEDVASTTTTTTTTAVAGDVVQDEAPVAEETNILKTKKEPKSKAAAAPKKKTVK